jgi:acylphosphatase
MVRAHLIVSGNVQGVFFRYSTAKKANELGLYGWVKNLRDGRVEAVFEGPDESVREMTEWCGSGPEGAYVSNINVEWEKYAGEFTSFNITR